MKTAHRQNQLAFVSMVVWVSFMKTKGSRLHAYLRNADMLTETVLECLTYLRFTVHGVPNCPPTSHAFDKATIYRKGDFFFFKATFFWREHGRVPDGFHASMRAPLRGR